MLIIGKENYYIYIEELLYKVAHYLYIYNNKKIKGTTKYKWLDLHPSLLFNLAMKYEAFVGPGSHSSSS